MSDLFHQAIPVEFIQRVFDVMRRADWHQVPTSHKAIRTPAGIGCGVEWLPNIWMGVSVENQDYIYRIDHLRANPCADEVPIA